MKFKVTDHEGRIHTSGFFIDQNGCLYRDFGKLILKCTDGHYKIRWENEKEKEKSKIVEG